MISKPYDQGYGRRQKKSPNSTEQRVRLSKTSRKSSPGEYRVKKNQMGEKKSNGERGKASLHENEKRGCCFQEWKNEQITLALAGIVGMFGKFA